MQHFGRAGKDLPKCLPSCLGTQLPTHHCCHAQYHMQYEIMTDMINAPKNTLLNVTCTFVSDEVGQGRSNTQNRRFP